MAQQDVPEIATTTLRLVGDQIRALLGPEMSAALGADLEKYVVLADRVKRLACQRQTEGIVLDESVVWEDLMIATFGTPLQGLPTHDQVAQLVAAAEARLRQPPTAQRVAPGQSPA